MKTETKTCELYDQQREAITPLLTHYKTADLDTMVQRALAAAKELEELKRAAGRQPADIDELCEYYRTVRAALKARGAVHRGLDNNPKL